MPFPFSPLSIHLVLPHLLTTPRTTPRWLFLLLESLLGKVGKDKRSLVHLGAVVPAELHLLLGGPLAEGHPEVALGVLAADHEADLARGVGGDAGVGVLGDGEDLLAVLLELGNQGEVKPLVLGCRKSSKVSTSTRRCELD